MQPTEQTVDNERLEALLGQAVVDCGGTANAALVLIGDELASTAPSPSTARSTPTSSPRTRTPASAMSVNGLARRPPAATSATTPPRSATR